MKKFYLFNRSNFLKILVILLSVSSFLIAMLMLQFDLGKYGLAIKDQVIFVFLILSLFLFRDKYKYKLLIPLIPLIIYVIISSLISYTPILAKMAAIRQILIPYVLLFMGYQYIRTNDEFNSWIKFSILLILGLISLGFYERFLHLWTYIPLLEYFSAKSIPLTVSGYPVMFIEPIYVFQELELTPGIVRMVSTMLDPINFGHTLAFFIVVVYYNVALISRNTRLFLLIIGSIALVLTISKGAILQLFLVFFLLNTSWRLSYRIVLLVFLAIALIIVSKYHQGLIVHLNGFMGMFSDLSLFGHGIALVGNYASMFSGDLAVDSAIGDTYIGSLIGQLGIIGFMFWLFPFILIVRQLPKNHYLTRILIAQLIIAMLSENSFNLLSILFISISVGAYYGISRNDFKKIRN